MEKIYVMLTVVDAKNEFMSVYLLLNLKTYV